MSKPISQRQARRFRKRVAKLEVKCVSLQNEVIAWRSEALTGAALLGKLQAEQFISGLKE